MKVAFVPEENELREDQGPWPREPLRLQLLKSAPAGRTPSLAPEATQAWCPLRAMGAAQGKKVGAPEGPAVALDLGRETGSTRWEPSATHPLAPWGLGQALPTGLSP